MPSQQLPIFSKEVNMAESLTTREVAKLLRISDETVRRQIRTGKIRAVKVGKQWLVPGAELNRILEIED